MVGARGLKGLVLFWVVVVAAAAAVVSEGGPD